MDQNKIFAVTLGMALVTYASRMLPIWLLEHFTLPFIVEEWLKFVPAAVMAALLFPAILLTDNQLNLHFSNLFLWVSFPTLLIAWLTRNFFGTVVAGSLLVAGARYFGY